MQKSIVETLMGAVVLIIAGFFVFISYESGNISSPQQGYEVVAKFREVGSLAIGSDVRVGGIKVGSVANQALDYQTYTANVTLHLRKGVLLPKDSSASIVSDGLLGSKYVSVEPGADEMMLVEGDVISYTQDAVNLEALLGKFAFGSVGQDDEENQNDKSDVDL